MAAGQRSLDFVGYTTGAGPPTAGFKGFIDFVGYAVGAIPGAVTEQRSASLSFRRSGKR